jgi:hypothetical protein
MNLSNRNLKGTLNSKCKMNLKIEIGKELENRNLIGTFESNV